MANFLYNGYELPDINTVWTDKTTYPYAVIETNPDLPEIPSYFYLILHSSPRVFDGEKHVYTEAGVVSLYHIILPSPELEEICNAEGITMEQLAEMFGGKLGEYSLLWTINNVAGGYDTSNPIKLWTSSPIINTADNSIYLDTSDPVPVGGATPEYAIIPTADYKAACDAIRAKTGKTALITSGNMASEIASVPTGGGMDINGVVKAYQVNAGASVNAGDFVEFVTRWGNGEFNSGAANYISAVALSDSKVLIAYADGGNSSYGTAVVLTINGTTISIGDKHVFANTTTAYISAVALTDCKVFVAHQSNGLETTVLTVEGSTIAHGTSYDISASTTTAIAATALSDSKVLLVYGISGSKARARVVTIEDSAQYVGDEHTLGFYVNSDKKYGIVALTLTSSKALVVFADGGGSGLGAAEALTISGTTIKEGAKQGLSGNCNYISAVALSDSKVLIAYADGGNSSYGTAVVLTINGTDIYEGEPVVFSSSSTAWTDAVALSDSKVLVSRYGSAYVLTVDGTTISVGNFVCFNRTPTGGTGGTYKEMIALSSDCVFVAFNYNAIGHYKCLKIEDITVTVQDTEDSGTVVQPATNRLHNVGVAKTSGAEGEMVEVYCVK